MARLAHHAEIVAGIVLDHQSQLDAAFHILLDRFDHRDLSIKNHVHRVGSLLRADAMDMVLDGKIAVIEAVEQDVEGGVQLALVIEDDPGNDLGMMRQPGHRFFYGTDEVEPVKDGV